jgi:hypothetical protein
MFSIITGCSAIFFVADDALLVPAQQPDNLVVASTMRLIFVQRRDSALERNFLVAQIKLRIPEAEDGDNPDDDQHGDHRKRQQTYELTIHRQILYVAAGLPYEAGIGLP